MVETMAAHKLHRTSRATEADKRSSASSLIMGIEMSSASSLAMGVILMEEVSSIAAAKSNRAHMRGHSSSVAGTESVKKSPGRMRVGAATDKAAGTDRDDTE